MNIRDVHTHCLDAGPDAVINIEPDRGLPPHGGPHFSTAVHPWRSAEAETLWPLVEAAATDARIVAVGECGLDRLRGAAMPEQIELMRRHALLAERVGKPLIVHCVRAWAELLALHRSVRPAQPWVVHGFRGAPALAQQLLDAGMYISLGPKFRPDTAAMIPAHRLLLETDDTPGADIDAVARAVADARHSTDQSFFTHTIFT